MDVLETKALPGDPSQGYFVDYQHPVGDASPFGHFFCGSHEVVGAWCPNCQKPLLRFLSLDTRDPRLNLEGCPFPTLSLLFCWTCNLAQDYFFYHISDDGSVELLQCRQGGVVSDFPYADYPVAFPGAEVALPPLSPEEQRLINRINSRFEGETDEGRMELRRQAGPMDLWNVRHQVGGEPFLTQSLIDLKCPLCCGGMPLLASVADDCLDFRGFVGNSDVQVIYHYCRPCHVVGAYQMVD